MAFVYITKYNILYLSVYLDINFPRWRLVAPVFIFVFFFLLMFTVTKSLEALTPNNRSELWNIGVQFDLHTPLKLDFLPLEQLQIPGPAIAIHPMLTKRQRRHRKQRGNRAGIRARLHANPCRPALPVVFVANVTSLTNKIGEMC